MWRFHRNFNRYYSVLNDLLSSLSIFLFVSLKKRFEWFFFRHICPAPPPSKQHCRAATTSRLPEHHQIPPNLLLTQAVHAKLCMSDQKIVILNKPCCCCCCCCCCCASTVALPPAHRHVHLPRMQRGCHVSACCGFQMYPGIGDCPWCLLQLANHLC